ncbi:MAG TPA: pyridoxamine 5'-phosphate oxidase family protein [Candidatus Binatia bacterium]|jgi:PPOX class probable F420-dependent enzyme|nr:pyridoxamine 5'-phosphate oxidase family protein [Candidatus Binatia bacterium]
MEWKEALPLLRENHTAVAISVTPKGHAQSTIVSTALLDDKLGFASRPRTVKLKNIQRTGRAAITVIKLDNRRYVTVEGPASIEPWQNTPAHIKRLKDFYASMGRAQKGTDEDFARQMRAEERSLILITPEHVYGSLQSGA